MREHIVETNGLLKLAGGNKRRKGRREKEWIDFPQGQSAALDCPQQLGIGTTPRTERFNGERRHLVAAQMSEK
jgi:hypothetical protein